MAIVLGVGANGAWGCGDSTEPAPAPTDDTSDPPLELGGGGSTSEPKDPPKNPPVNKEVKSGRGAGCSVKNDCVEGFSCIRGICQPLRFEFQATGKECTQIDCEKTKDCCGNLDSDVPDKCKSRAAKCTPTLPGCVAQECTRSDDCGGGGSCVGRCAVSSGECTGEVDCLDNRCLDGSCVIDFGDCRSDADCTTNSCLGGNCSCGNPSYDPSDPICEDEECEDLCLWACEDSRCVIPSECDDNDDCFGAARLCSDGNCVQCISSADCSFDKICTRGQCETPCRNDLHCSLFEACEAGRCIYVGCRSDRECTLIPSTDLLDTTVSTDQRLLRCSTQDGVGHCIVPCQYDAQCGPTEICSGGICEYIGCETNAECKTIVGLVNQQATEEQPWIARVECRAPQADDE